jgi:hypothetical protein
LNTNFIACLATATANVQFRLFQILGLDYSKGNVLQALHPSQGFSSVSIDRTITYTPSAAAAAASTGQVAELLAPLQAKFSQDCWCRVAAEVTPLELQQQQQAAAGDAAGAAFAAPARW